MNEVERQESVEDTIPERVAFDYIKSNAFRVIHADGAVGGLTPRGKIHFAIYSERGAIPQRVVHPVAKIDGDIRLLDEIDEERVIRDAVIREVEVDVVLDVATAQALVEWLTKTIQRAQEVDS